MPQLARPAVFVEGPHEVFVIEGSSMMIFGLLFDYRRDLSVTYMSILVINACTCKKNLELYCLLFASKVHSICKIQECQDEIRSVVQQLVKSVEVDGPNEVILVEGGSIILFNFSKGSRISFSLHDL